MYLPLYLHAYLTASHDVTHFTKGCLTKCDPLPNLWIQVTIFRHRLT